MYTCPECAGRFDLTSSPSGRQTCPNCGSAVRNETQCSWTDVARLSNLAEAGFLTDELIGLGMEARIYQLDEFSAVSDRWRSQFLIQVPETSAHDAAARIRHYMSEDTTECQHDNMFRISPTEQTLDPLFWRPVALVVLAGVASFVLGQRLSDQNAERPVRNSLTAAMGEIARPLTTSPAANQPRFRLSFDRRRETWLLESDRDGDGKYDSRQRFHASGAAW